MTNEQMQRDIDNLYTGLSRLKQRQDEHVDRLATLERQKSTAHWARRTMARLGRSLVFGLLTFALAPRADHWLTQALAVLGGLLAAAHFFSALNSLEES